jgi:quinol-cytochrome oxidoreductase complex cytochrome b subunit
MLRRFTPPRELVWLSALALLGVGVLLAFTGVILPWSQEAYLQARISSEMAGQSPLVGPWLRTFLRGGQEVGTWTLHHVYGFHIGVLPAVTSILLALHLLLGLPKAAHASEAPASGHIRLYPDFIVRLAALWTGVLALVISLATFVPQSIGTAADLSLEAPADVAPPWYLLFLHQLLRAAPARLLGVESAKFIIGGLGLVAFACVILPFIDRRGSRASLAVGVGFLALYLLLTAYALI